jgi:hypothetical protein
MGVEAIGSDWDRRMIQANIALPDGRVLIGSQVGEAHPGAAADAQPGFLDEARCSSSASMWLPKIQILT